MAAPCNRCAALLTSWDAVANDDAVCVYCGAHSIVRVFPALFQGSAAPAVVEAAGEGEAACYDHPAKRAVAHCAQCGRFVCQLCAVDFRGETWCPGCIAAGVSRKKTVELEQDRVLYDSLALTMALAPLIMWPVTIISGPATVFTAIRYWRRPLSLVRRNRWRAVLAIILGLAETGGWIWLVAYLILRAGVQK